MTCSDMHAGSEEALQVLAEGGGGSIEPVELPWLRACNLLNLIDSIII